MKQRRENRFWVQTDTIEPVASRVWPKALVRIFEEDRQIGTYERNLAGWAETTFAPFEWQGAWFALYAPDYTSTRVMSLPDCKDLGGEEPAPHGFCPVEYHCPRYRQVTCTSETSGKPIKYWQFSSENDDNGEIQVDREFGPWVTVPTAFVAGCQWGDDSTWKLECIDLPLAAAGQIVRTARFGHIQLARGHSLANSLRFDRYPPHWDLRMTLIRQERRDVATGALIDPYDE